MDSESWILVDDANLKAQEVPSSVLPSTDTNLSFEPRRDCTETKCPRTPPIELHVFAGDRISDEPVASDSASSSLAQSFPTRSVASRRRRSIATFFRFVGVVALILRLAYLTWTVWKLRRINSLQRLQIRSSADEIDSLRGRLREATCNALKWVGRSQITPPPLPVQVRVVVFG
jgi:hypothetical protein